MKMKRVNMMKTRKSQPKNNKHYIRTATGGYNAAVAGKPTIKGANVLCNCVGYANGRFNEIINDPDLKGIAKAFKYQLVCNAENFIESAKKQGLKISSTPIQGGIMVWQKGKTLGGSDGAGHVAVVEEVYADGTILTSESGWNAWAFKTVRRNNTNGRWGQVAGYKFRGCIVNPAVKDPKVAPAPKLTVDGKGGPATVRAMQRFFETPQDGVLSGQSKALAKYYPAITAVEYGKGGSVCVKKLQKWLGIKQDGIIGQATVKAWQKKLGVKADGLFGTNSMKAWQKYLNENSKAVYPVEKPTTTSKPAATAPATSSNAQKIVDKAKEYAYPNGTASKTYAYKTGKPKASYPPALKKYMGKKAKISQTDCGYFVNTCVRAAGLGKFTALGKNGKAAYPSLVGKLSIVSKGKKITSSMLRAGDIVRYHKTNGGQHVVIILGGGLIAHASRKNAFPRIQKKAPWNNSNVKTSSLQILRAK